MTTNNVQSYLGPLNKIIDEYNNNYHRCSGKKRIINNSALTEETETNPKASKFKVGDGVRIAKHKNIFSKCYTKKWSKEIFFIDSMMKTNPWRYRIKDLNEDEIMKSFYEKELLLSKL